MSPSISALGTSAATESITTTSIAPLLTSVSHISSASSPVSGCDTYSSSTSTPRFSAYTGSSACSASINAAVPPSFCASAIMCSAIVVLPDDSGPYISIILPLGMPPTPRARSSSKQPEGIVDTDILDAASPNLIMAPLPKSFSIWLSAISNAFSFSIIVLNSAPSFSC